MGLESTALPGWAVKGLVLDGWIRAVLFVSVGLLPVNWVEQGFEGVFLVKFDCSCFWDFFVLCVIKVGYLEPRSYIQGSQGYIPCRSYPQQRKLAQRLEYEYVQHVGTSTTAQIDIPSKGKAK